MKVISAADKVLVLSANEYYDLRDLLNAIPKELIVELVGVGASASIYEITSKLD